MRRRVLSCGTPNFKSGTKGVSKASEIDGEVTKHGTRKVNKGMV